MRQRLTPYVFFILAILAFAMIGLQEDDGWQTQQVDLLDTVLVIGGVLIAAHVLRKLVDYILARRKDRGE